MGAREYSVDSRGLLMCVIIAALLAASAAVISAACGHPSDLPPWALPQ